jgi:hypothetical protein
MWDRRNRRYSCTRMRADLPENKMPTTATVASIAAGYLVNEALLLLHAQDKGKGEREEGEVAPEHPHPKEGLNFGQKLYLMFKPYSFHLLDLPADNGCYAHERYLPVEALPYHPSDLTVLELLQQVELLDGVLELGYDLLTEVRCVQCGRSETIMRPLERCPESLGRCPDCNALTRQPETISWVDAESPLANRVLAELGIPDYQILAVKGTDETRYVQLGREAIWNEEM